jgi:hypothetical protein
LNRRWLHGRPWQGDLNWQQNLDVLHGRGKAMRAMYDNVHLTEDVNARE